MHVSCLAATCVFKHDYIFESAAFCTQTHTQHTHGQCHSSSCLNPDMNFWYSFTLQALPLVGILCFQTRLVFLSAQIGDSVPSWKCSCRRSLTVKGVYSVAQDGIRVESELTRDNLDDLWGSRHRHRAEKLCGTCCRQQNSELWRLDYRKVHIN